MELCRNRLHPKTPENTNKERRCIPCRRAANLQSQRKARRKPKTPRQPTISACQNCGEQFGVFPSKQGERKYCSDKCRLEVAARLRQTAYCANNHELNDDTIRFTKDGKRYCRECRNESMRKHRAAKKTTCQYGHAMTPDNVTKVERRVAGKKIRCRACKKCQERYVCGHPKTESNRLPYDPNGGGGGCKTCHLARQAKSYAITSNIRSCTGRPEGAVPAPVSDDWHRHGRCRGADTDKWFPENYIDRIEKARAACKECPVRKLCLAEGVGHGYGVWGGSTEKDRAEYRLGYIDFDELNERAAA